MRDARVAFRFRETECKSEAERPTELVQPSIFARLPAKDNGRVMHMHNDQDDVSSLHISDHAHECIVQGTWKNIGCDFGHTLAPQFNLAKCG